MPFYLETGIYSSNLLFKKKMLFLYSAHISLKQRLKALYNIPPTDLVKPLPTQLPGKHTRSAATGARP